MSLLLMISDVFVNFHVGQGKKGDISFIRNIEFNEISLCTEVLLY